METLQKAPFDAASIVAATVRYRLSSINFLAMVLLLYALLTQLLFLAAAELLFALLLVVRFPRGKNISPRRRKNAHSFFCKLYYFLPGNEPATLTFKFSDTT